MDSTTLPDAPVARRQGTFVNDIHSQLNRTRVASVQRPETADDLARAVDTAARRGAALSLAGGRHAMGGQQFGRDTVCLDLRGLDRVLTFDPVRGLVEVEAGVQWPQLIDKYLELQRGQQWQWGIAQKQTGADRLTIGGTLSANAHGRGLTMRPFVHDIEAFTVVDADGNLRSCSRSENPELFSLVVGGYGLFGVVYSVTLRLSPRRKLERVVEMRDTDELIEAFDERIQSGYLYGDFQFAIDEKSDEFLRRGVLSCYRPVDRERPMPETLPQLRESDWRDLILLAHTDKSEAFRRYSEYYLSTSGQLYWSDLHQLGVYVDDYHRDIDCLPGRCERATEVITEIYVPRRDLAGFLDEAREDFRRHGVDIIYGTIRLIEKDEDSFLAWACDRWACVVFNLHTDHTEHGIEHSAAAFRRLIDMAIRRGGSYFLTYHRFAERSQLEACYPRFGEFLELKRKYDSGEVFQSEWYRHYR